MRRPFRAGRQRDAIWAGLFGSLARRKNQGPCALSNFSRAARSKNGGLPLAVAAARRIGVSETAADVATPLIVAPMRNSSSTSAVLFGAYGAVVYGLPHGLALLFLAGLIKTVRNVTMHVAATTVVDRDRVRPASWRERRDSPCPAPNSLQSVNQVQLAMSAPQGIAWP